MSDEAPPTPAADEIRARHAALLRRLRTAAEQNGHDPDRLRIVGITKTWPIEVARAAFDAGLTALGENRVQEAEPKVAALPEAEWHFVGRLQANKARRAVHAFAVIHSVDSRELLERLADLADHEGRDIRLLLQVNLTGEPQKAGFAPGALPSLAAALGQAPVIGLMAMGRAGAPADESRATFAGLRELRDRLQEAAGIGLPELSMGMSDDAEHAAAEGATLVRIGTALFGPRG